MTDNVALVKDLYAAFQRGDVDAVIAAMAPDIDWRSVGDAEDWPGFGRRRGVEEVRGYFAAQAAELDFTGFEVRDIDPAGDDNAGDAKVLAEGVSSFNFRQGGLPASAEWVHIFTLRDGRIVRFREYMDTSTVSKQRADSHRLATA